MVRVGVRVAAGAVGGGGCHGSSGCHGSGRHGNNNPGWELPLGTAQERRSDVGRGEEKEEGGREEGGREREEGREEGREVGM